MSIPSFQNVQSQPLINEVKPEDDLLRDILLARTLEEINNLRARGQPYLQNMEIKRALLLKEFDLALSFEEMNRLIQVVKDQFQENYKEILEPLANKLQLYRFLRRVDKASTLEEMNRLIQIAKDQFQETEQEIMRALARKLHLFQQAEHRKIDEKIKSLKRKVSTFDPDLNDITFKKRIIEKTLASNTYEEIRVNTLESYPFIKGSQKARKIELIRTQWGICKFSILNLPLFRQPFTLSSAAFNPNSIYRKEIDNTLVDGILASTKVIDDPEVKQEYERQLQAAYWCGKKIEIIVPLDFSEEGVVEAADESKILAFYLNLGKPVGNALFGNS